MHGATIKIIIGPFSAGHVCGRMLQYLSKLVKIHLTFSEAVMRQTDPIFNSNTNEHVNRRKIFGDRLPKEFCLW